MALVAREAPVDLVADVGQLLDLARAQRGSYRVPPAGIDRIALGQLGQQRLLGLVGGGGGDPLERPRPAQHVQGAHVAQVGDAQARDAVEGVVQVERLVHERAGVRQERGLGAGPLGGGARLLLGGQQPGALLLGAAALGDVAGDHHQLGLPAHRRALAASSISTRRPSLCTTVVW